MRPADLRKLVESGIDIKEFTEGANFLPNVYIILSIKGYQDGKLGNPSDYLERTKKIVAALQRVEQLKAEKEKQCPSTPSDANAEPSKTS